jgi:uncharacterized FlgJ-related protein
MSPRKLNGRITWPGSLLLFLFLAALALLWKSTNRRKKMSTKNEIYKTVYALLIENGIPFRFAQIITAQAAHETYNFSSRIFIENHNLFGMKLAKIRKTLAIGERYGHAIFRSLEDSVKDLILYFEAQRIDKNFIDSDSYIETIKNKGYFEASIQEYQKGTAYFLNMYFGNG